MITLTVRADYNIASVLIGCGLAWIASSAVVVTSYGGWAFVQSIAQGYSPTFWNTIGLGLIGLPMATWGAAMYSIPYMLCIAAPVMLVIARWFGPDLRLNTTIGGVLGLLAGLLIPETQGQLVSGPFFVAAACVYGALSGLFVTRTMYA